MTTPARPRFPRATDDRRAAAVRPRATHVAAVAAELRATDDPRAAEPRATDDPRGGDDERATDDTRAAEPRAADDPRGDDERAADDDRGRTETRAGVGAPSNKMSACLGHRATRPGAAGRRERRATPGNVSARPGRVWTAGAWAAMAAGLALAAAACVDSVTPPAGAGGDGEWSVADAVVYRDDLASHPGCSTDDMTYDHGGPAGYLCAAKVYPVATEDTSKPIVLLIHGNSDTPDEWERWPKDTGVPMIAETLTGLGYRTLAVDLRIDRVDDPQSNNDTENAARNIDHGWATPIAQHFIRSAMEAEPSRRFTVIGFSLGATIIRDALRRLHVEGAINPWERLEDVVLLAGANHGVSTYARLCGKNPTMRGQVACELGSRDSFAPTDFMSALNGPDGAYETPCSDGDTAYGAAGACGGNTVSYTTVVMRDIADGSYQDEFVSESSSALAGADNRLIELDDTDETGYFFNGLLKNHYGAARSQAALDIVVEVVGD